MQNPFNLNSNYQAATIPRRNPIRVLFNRLPITDQEKLLKMQRGERGEYFSHLTVSPIFRLLFLIASLLWIGILFYLTEDSYWSGEYKVALTLITAAAMAVFFWMLTNFVRSYLTRLQPHVFITPVNFIKTTFNFVKYWDLEQLTAMTLQDNYYNGKYTYTTVKFVLDGEENSLTFKNPVAAEELTILVEEWQTFYRQAIARHDQAYLNAHNIFSPTISNTLTASPVKTPYPSWAAPALVLLFAVPLTTAFLIENSIAQNDYHSDHLSWVNTQYSNDATSYRGYLESNPTGRWRSEAQQKLDELYNNAAQSYSFRYGQKADPEAVRALLQLLDYAKQKNDYYVQVVFERHNDLPEDLSDQLKEDFGVSKILPIDNAFDEATMRARERSIEIVIDSAFKKVIPEGILNFVLGYEVQPQKKSESPVMYIKYHINPGEGLYYKVSEESLDVAKRNYYPGIQIDWLCELHVPNNPAPYQFTLTSNPAKSISYYTYSDKDESDLSQLTIYDSMAGSAFSDFGNALKDHFGLPTQTESSDDEPPVISIPPTTIKPKAKPHQRR